MIKIEEMPSNVVVIILIQIVIKTYRNIGEGILKSRIQSRRAAVAWFS